MDPRLLIDPFPFRQSQRRSVRRKAPVVKLRKIIFDLKKLTTSSFERIEHKECKLALAYHAVDALRGWGSRTLMIADPAGLQDWLRSASRQRHSHEWNRGRVLS